jgi:hypothetical protein|tara:strand:+ start:547 stop:1002 length:456 start_codon:yes stop_codon:yes gene_type:complete
MKKMILYTLLIAFYGCLNEPQLPTLSSDYEVNEAIPLEVNEKVSISSDNLHLSFVKVVDESRCPKTWKCLWEGEVEIEIKVEKGEISKFIKLKYQGGKCTECGDAVSILGYKIKLEKLSPHPNDNFYSKKPMNFGDYKIVLEVTKDEEIFS